MSASYLILYEGVPEDPEAFFAYYVTHHVPLVWRFPGIRTVEVMRGAGEGDFFMITRLQFDSLDALRAGVSSPEREAARADMANFPPFAGTVRWQIAEDHPSTGPEGR